MQYINTSETQADVEQYCTLPVKYTGLW